MPTIYQNDGHFLLIANHIIAVIFDKSISDIIPRFTRKILNINMYMLIVILDKIYLLPLKI